MMCAFTFRSLTLTALILKRIMAVIVMLTVMSSPLHAITPEEQLSDPILEDRARAISAQLRCLVCQNQSIDDSDADLARDLRFEVRNLLTQGFSDDAVLNKVRATYGDYVLLNPPISRATGLLWGAPFILILLGGFGLFMMRRRSLSPHTNGISTQPKPDLAQKNTPSSDDVTLSPKVFVTGFFALIIITAALYAMLGRPDLDAQPLAARKAEIADATQREQSSNAALDQALQDARLTADENPTSVESHLRLAMIAAEASAHDIELAALEHALNLTGGDLSIKAIKAEALSRKAGGLVTIPARDLIADVLSVRPDDPRALYLFGLSAYQDEDYLTALDRWSQLQSMLTPQNPLVARLAVSIADAAERAGVPVPQNTSPFAIAADLSEDERNEMIIGMVEGLEARLEVNPNDPQGWDRLIKARQVLGDIDALTKALIAAADAFPNQLERQVIALEAIVLEQQEVKHLDHALILLERINKIAPRGPQFLFFAGHFALISGEIALAATLWQELEAGMDNTNPLKAQLQEQINALKQN